MYLNNHNKYDCCGCSACVEVCPKSCIELEADKEGFYYPIKDQSSCIECGLCEKVCPFFDYYTRNESDTPEVYAAYDEASRKRSSSGGLFYTIARYIIEEKKGWVFGAAFDDKFQLHHIGVDNLIGLEKLRGSKYLQSKMGDTFTHIKELLKQGTFVFFVGTPCQVAGLRGFLRKDYKDLLVADLVCHGVPSQKIFDEHISYLQRKNKAQLTSYKFRYEDGWGGCEIADFANPSKQVLLPSYDLSPYLYSFMYAYTYRYSCYNCRFAKIPRQGDITLADFWGVKKFFPQIDENKGVSLLLINNHLGHNMWNNIKEKCVYYKSDVEKAACHNSNLVKKSIEPEMRRNIYDKVFSEGYDRIASTEFKSPRYNIIRIINFINSFAIFKPFLKLYRKIKK